MQANTILILEADDRLRTVLTLFFEDLGLHVLPCAELADIDKTLVEGLKADYLMHRGDTSPVVVKCFELTGRVPKVLPAIDFMNESLPDLNEIRSSFLRAV